ncbi:tail completion protein gp17 [Pseudomonas lundensis]|uniref:DUF3168 domain-containing protein n=1 Tax=Pseudomonas lundensis TaxID=86185 RepID=A0AAX2H8J8_9PSED|nr:DUF3168 domain-containing protein [Pseudomonas lundensis]NNA18884.1 DUF3168 domain-containing protein [Pseudomonas lundensis]SOB53038.1 conserved hypothetical protein [Pseudomonas lundensis]
MIEVAIAARLASLAGGHVYPEIAPSDAPSPRLTWTLVGGGAGWTLSGWDGSSDAQLQVDAWALSKREAIVLAEQVFSAISACGTDFCVSDAGRLPDDYEPDSRLFRVSWEYTLQP